MRKIKCIRNGETEDRIKGRKVVFRKRYRRERTGREREKFVV